MTRLVELHPYDPDWVRMYQAEAAILKPIFGDQLVHIEHFGSTAIPGILAKPIIDILISVSDIDSVKKLIPSMEDLGYEYHGERGIPGRQYFRREPDPIQGYHVHFYQVGHEVINEKIDFRDYLRSHPERARAYNHLKKQLATKYRENRSAYGEGKAEFISETLRLVAKWRKKNNHR